MPYFKGLECDFSEDMVFPAMCTCSIADVESLVSVALNGQTPVKSRGCYYFGFHFFTFTMKFYGPVTQTLRATSCFTKIDENF